MLSGVLGNKKKQQAAEQLDKRLKALLKQNGNNVCSDCPERRPTSAFWLVNPIEPESKALGGFCCSNCTPLLEDLGKDVCEVTPMKISAGAWSLEQVEAMESSGNEVINAIYEAKLDEAEAENERQKSGYVRHKYQTLKFISKGAYQDVMKRSDHHNDEKLEDAETACPMEDTSLQLNDAFQESTENVLTSLTSKSRSQECLLEMSRSEAQREKQETSFSYPAALEGEPTTPDSSRPPRRRRSGRDLGQMAGENNDNANGHPQIRRRNSIRKLERTSNETQDNKNDERPQPKRRNSFRKLERMNSENQDKNSERPQPRRKGSSRKLDRMDNGNRYGDEDERAKPKEKGSSRSLDRLNSDNHNDDDERPKPRRKASSRNLDGPNSDNHNDDDERPKPRKRGSSRNLDRMNSDNHAEGDERPKPRRKGSSRNLDRMKSDNQDDGDERPKPKRKGSSRDLKTEGKDRSMRNLSPAGRASVERKSANERKAGSRASFSPIRRPTMRSSDLSKGDPLAATSAHERKPRRSRSRKDRLSVSSSNLEISWSPADFLDYQVEDSKKEAAKKMNSKGPKATFEDSFSSLDLGPTTVKDISGKPGRKVSRIRQNHHRNNSDPLQSPVDPLSDGSSKEDDPLARDSIPIEKSFRSPRRQESSSSHKSSSHKPKRSSERKSRRGVVPRSRSSAGDLQRLSASASFLGVIGVDAVEPKRESRSQSKRMGRTSSSPMDLERRTASTTASTNRGNAVFGEGKRSFSQDGRDPKPRRARQADRGGQQGGSCYKSRRAKMSASLSNIRFDDFPSNVSDEEEEILDPDGSNSNGTAEDTVPEVDQELQKKYTGTMQNIVQLTKTGVVKGAKMTTTGLMKGTKMTTTGVVKGAKMTTTGIVKGTKMTTTGVVKGAKMTTTGIVKGTQKTKKATTGLVQGTIETIRKTRESLAAAEAQHDQGTIEKSLGGETGADTIKVTAVAG